MQDSSLELLRRLVLAIDPLIAAAMALVVAAAIVLLARRAVRASAAVEARLDAMARVQDETAVRLKTMAEIVTARQADLARLLGDRIDGLGQRVGTRLGEAGEATNRQLERLAERLAVIDRAQKTLGDLAGEVVSLRHVLSDKQSRGAFGQGRMEAIVQDGLPAGAYGFQETLSNGTRPDCLVRMPDGAPALVVDAKFPLEAVERLKAAETDAETAAAAADARRDLMRHVIDVRQRYFVPGETQDTALVFVPSESLFAEIHERFADVVDKASRLRVIFVGPSLLMLSIQVVRAVLRDVRMREQAETIQTEVRHLVEDVERLRERALALQKHHGQAAHDVEQILTSVDRIARRGGRIDAVAFDEPEGSPAQPRAATA